MLSPKNPVRKSLSFIAGRNNCYLFDIYALFLCGTVSLFLLETGWFINFKALQRIYGDALALTYAILAIANVSRRALRMSDRRAIGKLFDGSSQCALQFRMETRPLTAGRTRLRLAVM